MTRIEFARCVAVLSAGVGREMAETQIDVWFELLGDLTFEQLKAGIVRGLRNYKFAGFPPVGQIREWAGAGGDELRIEDRAALAWGRLLNAIGSVGAYESVDFDDPAINAAVRSLGGWQALCDTSSHELRAFVRPRFVESYRAHVAAGVQSHDAEPLAGIIAGNHGRDGYEAPEPRRIETNLPQTVRVIASAPQQQPRRITSESVRKLASCLPTIDLPTVEKPAEKVLAEPEWEGRRAAQLAALRKMQATHGRTEQPPFAGSETEFVGVESARNQLESSVSR